MVDFKKMDDFIASQDEDPSFVPIDKIQPIANHTFKVVDDDEMEKLVASIAEHGVLSPVLLRQIGDDRYEMISGHRRMHAAAKVGLKELPAIIRDLTDDEAIIIMVNSNIQREKLLPSEKAYAYKMCLEAVKHRRASGTEKDIGGAAGERSRTLTATKFGVSGVQVSRYIRLTYLIPGLLDLVDEEKIQLSVAVQVSYVRQEVQKMLLDYVQAGHKLPASKITILKKYRTALPESAEALYSELESRNTHKPSKFALSERKLRKYFPSTYSTKDMENVIVKLLEEWKQNHINKE